MDQIATSLQVADGIDPEDALNLMSPHTPPGIVRVRGQVDSLHPWWLKSVAKSEVPDYYFGTLSSLSKGACIDFKIPGYAAPDVGQLAVFEGALTYEGRGNGSGLKILLSGHYVGTFSLPDNVETPLLPQQRAPQKSLIDYLQEKDGNLRDILVLGSDAAISNIKSVLGGYADDLQFEEVTLTNFQCVLEAIQGAHCDAVVLARDSDDDAPTFWNQGGCIRQLLASGKYFYSALSYAQRLTIADLFADEAFLTPAHFGQSIAAVLGELKIKKELCLALDTKTKELAELQAARENDHVWSERKMASQLFEHSQYKSRMQDELAVLAQEKHLTGLWATVFAVVSVVLLGALMAVVFDVGGIRTMLEQRV